MPFDEADKIISSRRTTIQAMSGGRMLVSEQQRQQAQALAEGLSCGSAVRLGMGIYGVCGGAPHVG
jgi:hypothetical protein